MSFLNRFGRSKGLTLIELLVVIAIIGILASVVLASLNSARKKGRDAKRVADIQQVQLALELYFDANSAYPTALAALATGGHIPAVPKDPLTSGTCRENYCYAYYPATSPTNYHLGANLEEATNPALKSDKDCNSGGTTCPGGAAYSGTTFDGADPIYDLVP